MRRGAVFIRRRGGKLPLLLAGDIVVTQDYGLAAMWLSRNAAVLNQNGMEFTDDNIDALLLARHTAKKIRSSGGRLKGQQKRTAVQDEEFSTKFASLLGMGGNRNEVI